MSQTKRIIQNNFSLGELSPRTYGRHDQPWFSAGCRSMQDFIALPQGPAEARPGTIRISKLGDNEMNHRIKAVRNSEGNELLLLFKENGFHVYSINESGDFETATLITDSEDEPLGVYIDLSNIDLEELQVTNYEGKVYITHYNLPLTICEILVDSFSIELTIFTPSYNLYNEDNKASYVMNDIRTYRGKQYMSLKDSPINGPSEETISYRKINQSYKLDIISSDVNLYSGSETYIYGSYCIHNGSLWVLGKEEYKSYYHYNGHPYNTTSETQTDLFEYAYYYGSIPRKSYTTTQYISVPFPYDYLSHTRTTYHNEPNFGACNKYLTRTYGRNLHALRPTSPTGFVWLKVMALPEECTILYRFDSSGAGYVTGDYLFHNGVIFQALSDTGASPPIPRADVEASDWEYVGEAPDFNSEGIFPNLIAFHDRRLYVLGTKTEPNMIYASKTNDLNDFNLGIKDDESIQIDLQLEDHTVLSWGNSRKDFVIGAAEAEILISGGDGPITPSNIQAYPQSRAGSMRNGAIEISDATVFFQAGGQRLLRFVYSNDTQSYQTPDMGVLGEHLLSIGVKEFALQTNPDFILWCVMDDGTMLGGTYLPDQQIFGWHKHVTDGEFESVEVTRGKTEDIIWLIVRRPIRDVDGNVTSYLRQLERFAARRQTHDEKMVFMDDAEILPVSDGKATVSEDKKGQTLTVIHGGAPHQDVTADETTGEIQLQYELSSSAFNTCVVGRAYTPKLSPQKIIPGGSMLNLSERISHVSVRFLESLGLYVGIDQSDVDPLPVRKGTGNYGEVVAPFTGEEQIVVNDTFDGEGWLLIERQQPFPATILAVAYNLEIGAI